ncbi:MAG: rod shape-determining protein MreC [Patescibacteria group bacterium]|nr:rod shape-determining protein MreC [Patescibacteria group bacterium]
MKSLRKILGSFILLTIILVFIFSHNFIGSLLKNLKGVAAGFWGRCINSERLQVLQVENNRLKSEIALLGQKKNSVNSLRYKEALVYSRYPFNDRTKLIIDLGLNQDMKEGMAVALAPGVLLGKIIKVKNNQSEVMTLFDPEWRSSVNIGSSRIKALLKGGKEPRLEFIPQDVQLSGDEEVFNVSPEFPMNFSLGNLSGLSNVPYEIWRTADLKINYNPEIIEKVLVVLDFL